MFESLKDIDTSLFLWFNSRHNSFFDTLMFWASHDYFWIWFYIILLGFVFSVYKKKTLFILPIIALMILMSDQGANLVKHSTKRYRPCYNLAIKDQVHLNVATDENGKLLMPGQFGFVSSHASNTFALAFFLSMLLMKCPPVSNGYIRTGFRFFPLLIFLWAAFVSYSRIYNGVHYPFDVLGGALIGISAGFLAYKLWKYTNARLT